MGYAKHGESTGCTYERPAYPDQTCGGFSAATVPSTPSRAQNRHNRPSRLRRRWPRRLVVAPRMLRRRPYQEPYTDGWDFHDSSGERNGEERINVERLIMPAKARRLNDPAVKTWHTDTDRSSSILLAYCYLPLCRVMALVSTDVRGRVHGEHVLRCAVRTRVQTIVEKKHSHHVIRCPSPSSLGPSFLYVVTTVRKAPSHRMFLFFRQQGTHAYRLYIYFIQALGECSSELTVVETSHHLCLQFLLRCLASRSADAVAKTRIAFVFLLGTWVTRRKA